MKHVKSISTVKTAKAIDPAGAIFLQIWWAVFSWILTGAIGSKNN